MTDPLAGPTWLLSSRCMLGVVSLASGAAVVQLVHETRRAMHNQGGICLDDRVGCWRPMVGVISGGDSEHFDPFLV
jgi:hypothetical protein